MPKKIQGGMFNLWHNFCFVSNSYAKLFTAIPMPKIFQRGNIFWHDFCFAAISVPNFCSNFRAKDFSKKPSVTFLVTNAFPSRKQFPCQSSRKNFSYRPSPLPTHLVNFPLWESFPSGWGCCTRTA